MFNTRIITLGVALAACAIAFVATPVASAKGGDGVKVQGACTQSSTAKLKLSREDRRRRGRVRGRPEPQRQFRGRSPCAATARSWPRRSSRREDRAARSRCTA